MSHPYVAVRRSVISCGSDRGECVALVDQSYAEKALELFKQSDKNCRFWLEPCKEDEF